MALITKPVNLSLTWASGGDVLNPGDTKYATGWQVEIPPRQWFNYLDNRQDTAIAHINQHGVAVWDASTEYQEAKSYVQGSDGRVYIAAQTHVNQDPTTDITEIYWADIFKSGVAYFTTTGVTVWTVPTLLRLGIKKASVEVYGAGGGGGRLTVSPGASGGGQGGVAHKLLDLTGAVSVSITVGTGGVGGAADGQAGTTGGSSSFGAFCSATGGIGGPITANAAAGGSGVGGDFNIAGALGSPAVTGGGGSIYGGQGGGGSSPAAQTFGPPTVKGHGGGGRVTTAGADGAHGLVIVRW